MAAYFKTLSKSRRQDAIVVTLGLLFILVAKVVA